jgi:hypothetical protein
MFASLYLYGAGVQTKKESGSEERIPCLDDEQEELSLAEPFFSMQPRYLRAPRATSRHARLVSGWPAVRKAGGAWRFPNLRGRPSHHNTPRGHG